MNGRLFKALCIKRGFTVFAIMFFVFIQIFFFIQHGFTAIQLAIPSLEVPLDSTLFIPVEVVTNDPQGFYSWNLIVTYDCDYLTFVELTGRTPLTQNYTFLVANEPIPGTILIAGAVGYNPATGEDIPTIGTGILFKLKFMTTRQYPMRDTGSLLTIAPKNSPGNSLVSADTNHPGWVEMQPNLKISHIDPDGGLFSEDKELTIYGQGFVDSTNGSIPVIGYIQGTNTFVDTAHNLIKTTIPASSLPPGSKWDVIVTNPNGDFGVLKNAYVTLSQNGTLYYSDMDGDTYGDPNTFIESLTLPQGYVEDSTDCDDSDPNTYPGAPDYYDGKDNNCNGRIDEAYLTQDIPLLPGWNLISFQVTKCFYERNIPNVFIPSGVDFIQKEGLLNWLMDNQNSPIRDANSPDQAGDWQRIISFDNNGAAIIDKNLPPFINTLHYISFGYGYWVKMNKSGFLKISGHLATPGTSLYLKTGWNLIGGIASDICYGKKGKPEEDVCPYKEGIYRQEESINYCQADSFPGMALSDINQSIWRIISFDTCSGAMIYDKYIPPFINTLYYMGPKYGYWIKMETDGQLFVSQCP